MQFKSEAQLLAWACNFMGSFVGAPSSLRPRTGSGLGLAPHEQRALAAQIVTWLSTLPLAQRTVVHACHGLISPATAGSVRRSHTAPPHGLSSPIT